MRVCGECGISLMNSTLTNRTSGNGEVIQYLTCDRCGYGNLVTGYIDPRPTDANSGYLLYNERTELFDEYDTSGVLIRANVIPSPWHMPRSRDTVWPPEKQKPKRAGNETWVDERDPNDDQGDQAEVRIR